VVKVDVDDVGDGVPVCTTAPRVDEPDDQCAVVPHSGPDPFNATTEKLSTDDYVARNNLILLAVSWPEIKERIVGETNRLLATGMSFSAVHCEVEKLVQAVEPGIRATREERREQIRKGIVEPANAREREIAARARETDRLNAEADAAEIKAGIKKKAPKDSGKKCNPA
jgi:hypothetical protein